MSALTGLSQLSSVTQSTSDTPTGQPQEVKPEDYPKPSVNAVEFLEFIDDDDLKYVLFSDQLVTVSDTGKELGEFCVTVDQATHQGKECFLIHANSHGAIDGVPCGTSITAYVTRGLVTLEQQHHEYVKLENHPLDRKTFIVREGDEYSVNRLITQGEDVQRSSQVFAAEHLNGFISEGSNLLLQRLLVRKSLPDNFQLIAFDSDTSLCPVTYKELEPRSQVVQETEVEVYGIERTISSSSDLPTTWQCYFTKDGHLMSRVQVGSPVTMRATSVPSPIEEEEEDEKPTFGKKELNWEEDIELYSKFLDRKEELKGDHNVYMRHHPELKALLADFLQFLLLRKPDDVVAFAADYFASFSQKMPSMTPYLQSGAPTPFPESRTNAKIQHLATPR